MDKINNKKELIVRRARKLVGRAFEKWTMEDTVQHCYNLGLNQIIFRSQLPQFTINCSHPQRSVEK